MTIIFFTSLLGFSVISIASLFILKATEISGKNISVLSKVRTTFDPLVSESFVSLRHRFTRFLSFSAFLIFRSTSHFLISSREILRRRAGAIGMFLVRFAKSSSSRRSRGASSFFLKDVAEHKNDLRR